MREDMFKVIVERPRLLNSNDYSRDGRKYRNREDTPNNVGMKQGYDRRKWLNENLAPLKRYLAKQVNRPWDKIYSDICETIDARSTVKQHILQHIKDFVAINTHSVEAPEGGYIIIRGQHWPREDTPLAQSCIELYLHPRTGILLRNRQRVTYNAQEKRKKESKQSELLKICRTVDAFTQLHYIDGHWFELVFAELPPARCIMAEVAGKRVTQHVHNPVWDVLRKKWVSRERLNTASTKGQMHQSCLYSDPYRYAASKRQLNSRELKKHRLSR